MEGRRNTGPKLSTLVLDTANALIAFKLLLSVQQISHTPADLRATAASAAFSGLAQIQDAPNDRTQEYQAQVQPSIRVVDPRNLEDQTSGNRRPTTVIWETSSSPTCRFGHSDDDSASRPLHVPNTGGFWDRWFRITIDARNVQM
jgi:hypothetical protein